MTPLLAALALTVQASPSAAAAPAAQTVEQREEPAIAKAAGLVKAHQPQAALDVLEPVLAAYDADLKTETRRLYCGMSMVESILYAGIAAKDKANAVILQPGYCTALYLKGYALVDLNRPAEAKAIYRRLLTLAPMYAQYQTEYAQLLGREKDWAAMLAQCESAASAAEIAPDEMKVSQKGAALRCQGYALIEQHKLDEAEKRYRQALAIDPNDRKAQGELRFIAEQRAKAAG